MSVTNFTSIDMGLISYSILEYVPFTFHDRNKDEFFKLEQGNISVAAYEANFYVLSRYVTYLLGTKEERIW